MNLLKSPSFVAAGLDGAPPFQGGLAGPGPVEPDTGDEPPEDHFSAALELEPDEDVEFIRQLFLFNRFM